MFSNSSRLPSNVSYHQIANINDDTFLFCFDFPKLDFDFCCGCSLRSGVLFLGIFFIVCGIGSLLNILKAGTIFEFYTTIIMLIIYSIAFIFLLISGINFSYQCAYIAYLIYFTLLIFNLIEILIMTILIFIGDYTPAGSQSRIVKGIGFLLVGILLSGLYLYCLWIIFCYMIHLKYDRVELVCGDFNKIKNINTESLAGMKINEKNYKLI
jgi:hypothetical protein